MNYLFKFLDTPPATDDIFKTPWIPLVVFFGCLLMALIVGLSIKLIKRISKKDIRIFPELNVKTITYVAMLNAASVAIVIFVSFFMPITVLPPVRVSIESILVKITGFIFGPVIGLVTGVTTDILSNLLRPGYYFWGYTMNVALVGLISGLVRAVIRVSRENKNILFWCITAGTFMLLIALGFVFYYIMPTTFTFQYPHANPWIDIDIPKWWAFGLLSGALLISLIAIWFIFWYYSVKKEPIKFINMSSILVLAILTEFLIDITIAPIFDYQALGWPLTITFSYHLATSPIKIWGNFLIVYTVNKITMPLINKEAYESGEYSDIEYKPWFGDEAKHNREKAKVKRKVRKAEDKKLKLSEKENK